MTAGQIRAPTCIPLRSTPGSKQNIDDETPIELSCETGNTSIFYTINGEKPVPFEPKDRNTYAYTGPFLLMPGKRTIKSVAAYTDGRQSNTVTKVYYVRESNPLQQLDTLSLDSQIDRNYNHEEDNFKRRVLAESFRNNIQTLPPGGLYTASRAKARTSPGASTPTSPTGNCSPIPRTSSTPTKIGSTPSRKRRSLKIANEVVRQVRLEEEGIQANLTFTKEIDKCPQCFTDKPPNPLAKYCHQCSFYLPPNPMAGGTVKCLHCHSVIPADVTQCVVCNARITSQQLRLPTKEAIECSGCKFKNPPGSKTCVVCEERLELSIKPPQRPPPTCSVDLNQRQCKKCSRENAEEARYCDWCGSSMVNLDQPLPCRDCTFQNAPLALYCGNCGLSLLPKSSAPSRGCWSDEKPAKPPSDPVIRPPEPILMSVDTQTDGIFYKSAKRMQAEENKVSENMRQVYRSRGLSITKYSPGAGNWRQNIEHISNHIKVYSQLNSEYQQIIGKHQFGKVTMATLYKDRDEVQISYVFSSRKPGSGSVTSIPKKTPSNRKSTSLTSLPSSASLPNKRANSLVSNSELSDILAEELRSRKDAGDEVYSMAVSKTKCLLFDDGDLVHTEQNSPEEPKKVTSTTKIISNGDDSKNDPPAVSKDISAKKALKKKTPKDMHELRIGKLNSQLLTEITKDGDEQRVARLLGQGAGANTKTSGGVSVLCLAAKHKHFGAFKALVNAGADTEHTVPSTKETPLHIAVVQGAQDIVKFLVESGADFLRQNAAGHSALDVARKRHNQRAVQLFTASMGTNLLSIK